MKSDSDEADNIPLAVGAIVVTVPVLSLRDALIKRASGSFALWQIVVLRSTIAIPLFGAFLAVAAPGAPRLPRGLACVTLRSGMPVAIWALCSLSLPELALSAVVAACYTLPIFLTLSSALVIGSVLGPGHLSRSSATGSPRPAGRRR